MNIKHKTCTKVYCSLLNPAINFLHLFIYTLLLIFYIYLFVCVACVLQSIHVEVRGQLRELVLSSHHVGFRD